MNNRTSARATAIGMNDPRDLDDDTLMRRLAQLVRDDQTLEADLLAHVAEVDARRLFARHAASSMFQYCVTDLHLSDSAAYKRITAARAARRFPVLLARVARGELHLTAISLLAPHLTADNHVELIEAAIHKSKRTVEQLLAERFPRPEVPATVRKLPRARGGDLGAKHGSQAPEPAAGGGGAPVPAASGTAGVAVSAAGASPAGASAAAALAAAALAAGASAAAALAAGAPPEGAPVPAGTSVTRAASVPDGRAPAESVTAPASSAGAASTGACPAPPSRSSLAPTGRVEPLSRDRYKVQLTVGAGFCAKLQEARELLGHRVDPNDLATILERGLGLLVDDLKRKKHAVSPRRVTDARGARVTPAAGASASRPSEVPSGVASATGRSPLTPPQSAHSPSDSSAPQTHWASSSAAPSSAASRPSPRTKRRSASRFIPRSVRREVYERDQGQCAYHDARGKRCPERRGLEYHHIEPYALGGPATTKNLQLRCSAHNGLAAEDDFGAEFVRSFSRRRQRACKRGRDAAHVTREGDSRQLSLAPERARVDSASR